MIHGWLFFINIVIISSSHLFNICLKCELKRKKRRPKLLKLAFCVAWCSDEAQHSLCE